MKTRLCGFLSALIVLAILLGGCAASSPEDTLRRFVDSLNTGHYEDAIDCLSPEISAPLRIAINLLGSIVSLGGVSINYNEIIKAMPFLYSILPELSSANGKYFDPPFFTLEIIDKQVQQNTAKLSIRLTVDVGGSSQTEEGVCTLTKINSKWFISNIQ